jgi:L-rhamnose mutarotase
MKRSGFKMKLKPGFEKEYKKRHDEIWPELAKETTIVRKWWDFMSGIMEVNPDNSPIVVTLKEVFHQD